jgi:cytochrome c peroxidase
MRVFEAIVGCYRELTPGTGRLLSRPHCEKGFIVRLFLVALGSSLVIACGAEQTSAPPESAPEAETTLDRGDLRATASAIFARLPKLAASESNPVTREKTVLGKTLYFDPRLSKNHDISCNSCHGLNTHGVDNEPTSPGHRGQRGGRNSPTVYNAALHVAQFWDGRAADVEEQAKGPVLNPIEMAMPSEEATVAVLRSIPGYAPMFEAAFPDEDAPITYDNMARAIGAFERTLITPWRFDAFLAGDDHALSEAEVRGLDTFVRTGCVTCHVGPAVGGGMYQKLGLVEPYPTEDAGRFDVTGNEVDRGFFKVPSLRNVEKTGPWFHDGSITSLDEAIRLMARHQLGKQLSDAEVASIHAFLSTLTANLDAAVVAAPELPPSGPDTPAPDPS